MFSKITTILALALVATASAAAPKAAKCPVSKKEASWSMWPEGQESTCMHMQKNWKVCTTNGDPNHNIVMKMCPATCAMARGDACPKAAPVLSAASKAKIISAVKKANAKKLAKKVAPKKVKAVKKLVKMISAKKVVKKLAAKKVPAVKKLVKKVLAKKVKAVLTSHDSDSHGSEQ